MPKGGQKRSLAKPLPGAATGYFWSARSTRTMPACAAWRLPANAASRAWALIASTCTCCTGVVSTRWRKPSKASSACASKARSSVGACPTSTSTTCANCTTLIVPPTRCCITRPSVASNSTCYRGAKNVACRPWPTARWLRPGACCSTRYWRKSPSAMAPHRPRSAWPG
ncbi:hypothetical protein D3C72_1822140 [compost metagenome]